MGCAIWVRTVAFNTKSVLFGGTPQTVLCGNVLGFERTNPCSFSWWYKSTAVGTNTIVSKCNPSSVGYEIVVIGDKARIYWVNTWTSNSIIVTFASMLGTALNNGAWHHCTLTYNGGSTAASFNFYIDAMICSADVIKDALTGSILNLVDFVIGGYEFYCMGNIDELAVYSRELTGAEVAWLYNSGHPCSLTAGGAPANLLSWWRMGDGDTYPTLTDAVGGHNGTMTNMAAGNIVADVP